MTPDNPFSQPVFGKVILSFGIGIALGLTLTFPAIQNDLGGVTLGDTGPVGNVLLLGVLSIAVVTTGLFGLYRLFWLVDR